MLKIFTFELVKIVYIGLGVFEIPSKKRDKSKLKMSGKRQKFWWTTNTGSMVVSKSWGRGSKNFSS